jgi:hypothetical protein
MCSLADFVFERTHAGKQQTSPRDLSSYAGVRLEQIEMALLGRESGHTGDNVVAVSGDSCRPRERVDAVGDETDRPAGAADGPQSIPPCPRDSDQHVG